MHINVNALQSTLKTRTYHFIVFKDNHGVFEEFEVKDTIKTQLVMHTAFDIKRAHF